MANKYLYSGAAGAGTGNDFANAYTTIAAAIAGIAAGDTLYIANDHAEGGLGSNQTLTFPGTVANPNILLCVTRADPPTTLNTGAVIGTTGAFFVNLLGSFYCYGVTWAAGSGTASTVSFRMGTSAAATQTYDTCALQILSTGASSVMTCGNTTAALAIVVRLINTTMTFGAPGQKLVMSGGDLYWSDTQSAILGTKPTTTLFGDSGAARPCTVTITNVDFSALAAATKITPAYTTNITTLLSNCKFASGVDTVGEIFTDPTGAGPVNYAINCGDAIGVIRTQASLFRGKLETVTATYRNAGATNGTTNYSWTLAATADAKRTAPLRSVVFSRYNTSTSAMTATVEIATDNVTLTDNECWIEVSYPSSSSLTTQTMVSTACGLMGTPANLPTSSETWTGIPGTPVKQYIRTASFTPQAAGPITVRVCYAKASGTVYVDPVVTLA